MTTADWVVLWSYALAACGSAYFWAGIGWSLPMSVVLGLTWPFWAAFAVLISGDKPDRADEDQT